MLNKMTKDNFCVGFGSKILTHICTTDDETAPFMDQKCKFPISTAKRENRIGSVL